MESQDDPFVESWKSTHHSGLFPYQELQAILPLFKNQSHTTNLAIDNRGIVPTQTQNSSQGGKSDPNKRFKSYDSDRALSDFLRAKTFVLCGPRIKKIDWEVDCRKSQTQEDHWSVDKKLLNRDIQKVRRKIVNFWIKETLGFFTSSEWILNLLQRLETERISFREMGEGTDQKWPWSLWWVLSPFGGTTMREKLQEPTESVFLGGNHFSIWDKWVLYRQLFHIDTSVAPLLEKTIEMGRAFVERILESSSFTASVVERYCAYDH